MSTPDFPDWAGGFAAQVQRLRTTLGPTLHHLELLFGLWIPAGRLSQQDEGPHSRSRRWNLRLTFWTFLWQIAQAGASCREAIRQAQARCRSTGQRPPPDENSPYCQARGALPVERLEQIHDGLVAEAQAALAAKDLWCGHHVTVLDGSTVTAPDTRENQEVYPQQSVQKPGGGFPILRLVAFLSLATGLLTAWAVGSWKQSEVALLQRPLGLPARGGGPARRPRLLQLGHLGRVRAAQHSWGLPRQREPPPRLPPRPAPEPLRAIGPLEKT